MKTILQINTLRKTFADFTAVNDISLEAEAGEIFGFLGPNGAGKTTTIKILAGLLQPDSGTVTINGNSL
ncbi:MAG: ATP-binding cassette domain-containing protein, partial [Candidatus Electrothrix sp. ATG2]|nr:ATP-binding cassette domain-containing protein [Candidatus Electrothrix sp. ATG2]